MDPRLKTSTKWTPFPQELTAQIAEVLMESFDEYDLRGQFVVEGAIYPQELLLRIGLAKPGQLRQDNFEASMEYNPEDDKATEKIHVLVDFLGQVWEAYLEDEPEAEELPRQWKPERFEKNDVFLKYSTVNTNLEAEADKLLEMYEKKLVNEREEDEDLLPNEELAAFEDEGKDLH